MPKNKRVVFDTNVYVSLFAFPGGKLDRLWELAIGRIFDLFVSPFILDEFEEVALTKFHHTKEDVDFLRERILNVAQVVHPSEPVTVISQDHPDNEILSCALAARADVLVTGDKKHLRKLNTFGSIAILLPAEFLGRLP